MIGAVALGCAGWLYALLIAIRAGMRPTPITRVDLAALALPVLVLGGTLSDLSFLTRPAGLGFALGWAGGLLAGVVCLGAARRDAREGAVLFAGPAFAALAVISIAVLWLPRPLQAAPSAAIGWAAVSILLAGTRAYSPTGLGALLGGLGAAAILSATVALGAYRTTQQVAPFTWESTAISLAAAVPLGLLLAGLAPAHPRLPRGVRSAILSYGLPVIVVGVFALLLAGRVPRGSALPILAGVGLAMALMVRGLVAETARLGQPNLYEAVSALTVLGAFAAAFSALAGYGVGIMLLAAWPLMAQGADEDTSGTMARLATFGVLLLLYRLFAQRYQSELASASLTDHFALLGFLVGAVLPALMTAAARGAGSSAGGRLARVVLAALVGLSIPAAMVILWTVRVAPALLSGMAFAFAVPVAASRIRDEAIVAGTLVIPIALALTQWTGLILPLSELTRAERMTILVWIAAGIVLALLLAEYGVRVLGSVRRDRMARTARGRS